MTQATVWRTCQECGWVGQFKDPSTQKTEGWRNAKCRRCKSEALDYGSPCDPREPAHDYTQEN